MTAWRDACRRVNGPWKLEAASVANILANNQRAAPLPSSFTCFALVAVPCDGLDSNGRYAHHTSALHTLGVSGGWASVVVPRVWRAGREVHRLLGRNHIERLRLRVHEVEQTATPTASAVVGSARAHATTFVRCLARVPVEADIAEFARAHIRAAADARV